MQGISPAEFIELIQNSRASFIGLIEITIAIQFAFFAVTYFVGSKLSRLQAWVVAPAYSLFNFFLIAGLYSSHRLTANLVTQFYDQFPAIAPIYFIELTRVTSAWMAGMWAVPWALSILYLATTRR